MAPFPQGLLPLSWGTQHLLERTVRYEVSAFRQQVLWGSLCSSRSAQYQAQSLAGAPGQEHAATLSRAGGKRTREHPRSWEIHACTWERSARSSSACPEFPPGTLLLLTATGGDAGSSQSTCPARWEERTPAAPLERGGCFCCLQGCGQHAVAHYWCCWPSGDPKCQSSRVSLTDGAWTRRFCSRSLFPPVKWG